MKTKTEIQLTLTDEEREKLEEAYKIINEITSICMRPFDDVTFRCWDFDHDYVEFKCQQLADFTCFIHDIICAAEIGFNHIEKGQNNDKR